MKILLDTNFLIYCAENKLDYKEEISNIVNDKIELAVPIQVYNELKKFSQNSKEKLAASLALDILEKNNVEIIENNSLNADEALVELSKQGIVATIDNGIRKKVGRAILLRGKKQLILAR